MAERVLVNPLSGEEIVRAVLDKVGNSLRRDCYLSPNLAYDFYTADVKISLRAHDVGRTAGVNLAEVVTQHVETVNPEDIHLDAADAEFEIEAAPPNAVRVETGQDVPVLTRDTEGKPAIKPVRYSRKQLEKSQ